jgi:hypothetical protein
MSWNNLTLYLASIPSADDEENGIGGNAGQQQNVVNAWDLF